MTGMSLRLASSLRIVVGLFCMTLILLFAGKLHGASLGRPQLRQTRRRRSALCFFSRRSPAVSRF